MNILKFPQRNPPSVDNDYESTIAGWDPYIVSIARKAARPGAGIRAVAPLTSMSRRALLLARLKGR